MLRFFTVMRLAFDPNIYLEIGSSEAPNDETYAVTMLAIGAAGAVRSETLKGFTEEEYRNIIASIP